MNNLAIIGIVILLLGGVMVTFFDGDIYEIKGDCFDNHNNKINDLTCDVTKVSHNAIYFIGVVMIIIGTLIMFIDALFWEVHK